MNEKRAQSINGQDYERRKTYPGRKCEGRRLGGDHSISLPLLRAQAAKYGELAVIHFDSHPDMWDEEFDDQPFSHGTLYRRAIEEKLIDPNTYAAP